VIRKIIFYVAYIPQRFLLHLQCVATLPCESRKYEKMLANFHVERDKYNINTYRYV